MKEFLLLLLTFLIRVVDNEAIGLREMSDCHRGILEYKSGVLMELCCRIDVPDCVKDPSLFTIKRKVDGTDSMQEMHQTDSHSSGSVSFVKLSIPNPQERSDSGFYYCYCNGRRMVASRVDVIGKVDSPKILSITSTFKENVTVIFDPGRAVEEYRDKYTIWAQVNYTILGEEKVELCNIFCQGLCSCTNTINIKEKRHLVGDIDVTIIVKKERSIQHNDTRMTVNLIEHVKPEPVDEMKIEDIESTSAILALCAPNREISKFIMPKMAYHGSPLRLNVTVIKTQGSYEERKYNVTFSENSKFCLRIVLSQLTPFTRYEVSVTASGGGGYSVPLDMSFITRETAPLSPPEDLKYWMVPDKSANHNNSFTHQDSSKSPQTYSININLRSIPHDKKGGDISYKVCVSYKHDGNEINFNKTVNKPYLILRNIPDTSVTVNIYSENKMGLSKDFSDLRIQKSSVHTDISMIQSHVETSGILANVYLQKPPPNVEISAIYWCPGNQYSLLSEQLECQEYPEIVLSGTDLKDEKDILRAVVSLKKKKCQLETVSEFKQEVSYFYKDLTDQRKSSRRRQIISTVRVFANETNPCPSSSQNTDVSKEDPTEKQDFQHKFMFSVKDSHRLFPFQCYYDNVKDSMLLSFDQSKNEKSITLSWRQLCEFSPQQFLAKEYRVYTSHDGICHTLSETFNKVESKIIHPSEIEMFEEGVFVCVKGKKSSSFMSNPIPQKLEERAASGKEDVPVHTIAISVTTILIVCVFLGLVFCIRARRQKMWKYMQTMNPLTSTYTNSNYKKTSDIMDDSGYDYPHDYETSKSVTPCDGKCEESGEKQPDTSSGNPISDVGIDKGTEKHPSSTSETSTHSKVKIESGFCSFTKPGNSSGDSEIEIDGGRRQSNIFWEEFGSSESNDSSEQLRSMTRRREEQRKRPDSDSDD